MGANFGIAGLDWQQRVNWDRLRKYRTERARERMKAHGLGAMLLMYDENVRYVTGTLTPGWNRLKPGLRYAVLCGDDPVTLTRRLETALGSGRDGWPLGAIRTLWDALLPLERARARSPEHVARWLNLAGYLLRPGFGVAAHAVRIGRLWRVLSASEPSSRMTSTS